MKVLRPASSLVAQFPGHGSRQACRSLVTHQLPPTALQTQNVQRRTFFSNPFSSSPQTLFTTRTLPYPPSLIYSVIADINSYSAFLPYCRSSTVTKTSSPDADGNTWPEEAKVVIGFNDDIGESWWSRIYCDPGKVIEAVSGNSETTLSPDRIKHHSARPESNDPTRNASVLTHLLTRWTLRPFPFKPGPLPSQGEPQQNTSPIPPKEQTEVSLALEFQFANPIYATMSAAAAPKVAEKMVEAFEKRVRSVLDGPSMGGTSRQAGALEGVMRPKP
ncbi:Coenzyme Q-binding protein coq10, mitochondrial [Taxawa tesnikishii (nom. ined.)]|nr:Coenzyme Q-binding protein coq10, mitochondrial [Dothideales sp. JES 119]